MRYSSIDLLRMLAIFVMVFVHFAENLSGVVLPCAGFGAPLFALLSGVSYSLWVNGQKRKGKSEAEITKVSIRRGTFVVGAGFAFNVLVWLPEDLFNWDVLTFIGFSLLVLAMVRHLPAIVLLVAGALAVFIAPLLRALADYNSYWEDLYFQYDLTLTDAIIGFLAVGYFPIFPWIAYSLTGYVVGTSLFQSSVTPSSSSTLASTMNQQRPNLTGFGDQVPGEEDASTGLPIATETFGAGLLLVSLTILAMRPLLPDQLAQLYWQDWSMYPPSICYVLGTLGMSLILLGLGHRFVDLRPRDPNSPGVWNRCLDLARRFSQYSFTLYVVHHVVHIWPLWVYGTLYGSEPTQYWRVAMPLTISMPLALLFLAMTYVALRALGPSRHYGVESAMRWICD